MHTQSYEHKTKNEKRKRMNVSLVHQKRTCWLILEKYSQKRERVRLTEKEREKTLIKSLKVILRRYIQNEMTAYISLACTMDNQQRTRTPFLFFQSFSYGICVIRPICEQCIYTVTCAIFSLSFSIIFSFCISHRREKSRLFHNLFRFIHYAIANQSFGTLYPTTPIYWA